jgi:hypothetical protein
VAEVEVSPQEAAEKLALAAQEVGETIEDTRLMIESRDEEIASLQAQVLRLRHELHALASQVA